MNDFNNIEEIIKEQKITRRELEKFKIIIQNYQPNNDSLLSLLSQYIDRNVDKKTLTILEKTIDALLVSLDYPTEEWTFDEKSKFEGYKLVKDSIIEYCITDVNDISIIIDNVSFLNKKPIEEVKKNMQLYMSSYGNSTKIINAFRNSDDYQNNIKKSTFPEIYVPIYSKMVVSKIKEMEEIKKIEVQEMLQGQRRIV